MVAPQAPDALPRISYVALRSSALRHSSRYLAILWCPALATPSACLRHASRAQARAPTAPSSYHMSQIVHSPAYSAGLCAHDFSVCVPHPAMSLSAPCPPLRLNSADARLLRPHVSAALLHAFVAPYDTSSGVFTRLVSTEKEII